ncbi:complement C1q tumor necrosis factor-related protein 3-like [Xyrichtys novacula]|uniref:Complement C1q tumor necrosis factor-related protein 3-like n=1 Tax=Xyrichtys novacula TaxID=13765 RepID=A0AAV1GPF6_XYRNO|nr:complement C1q tumor necrosis factor-related protein 3-like [Xyrichtys novacula]
MTLYFPAAFASNSSTVSEEPISNSPDRGSLSAVNIPQTSGVNSSGSCELRLRGFEEQLENLKNVNSVQEGALSAVTVRLNMSEEQLDHLRTTNTELQVRLRVTEVTVEQLQTDSQAHSVLLSELTSRLESSERNGSELTFRQNINTKQLEELRNADSGSPSILNSETDEDPQNLSVTVKLRAASFLSELETRLSEGEKHLEELRMVNAELRAALSVGEKHLEELKTETTELETRLSVSEEQLEELKSENEELEARQSVSENQLEELKSENTELKIRLSVNKKQLEDLKTENTELETRQSVGEEQLEDLKTAKKELETRQSVNMKQLEDFRRVNTERETRLNISEKQLEDLNTEVTELELRLSTSEKQLGELRNQNTGLRFRLTESFDQLKNKSSGEQRVAFSAGLTDSGPVGPFDVETTLIFSKIITNIGNAYNATAGVFQAPVRGLYFFSFTAADYQKGYMGLHLYRNSQPITFNLDLNDHGGYASTSNSVALQLEAGDGVRLSLPASYRLYDDPRNFSVFSGFLLFPL